MNLEPQLVQDQDGKMHMQIRLGQFSATMPLPERMATYTAKDCQEFFNSCVPGMVEKLHEMQRDHDRKMRKKAECSGSGKSRRVSGEKT